MNTHNSSFSRRLLTQVMIFGVLLFALILLHIGFVAYNREQSTVENYVESLMETLILDLHVKTKSTQAVILSNSHAGNFNTSDTASVFRKLADFVSDDNFISNACLEVWDENDDTPDTVNELFYVGRGSDGKISHRHILIRDADTDPADMDAYKECVRTGDISWSRPYYDSLYCKSDVLTCYKKCDEPGMVLSADLKLPTLLENLDSLRIYKGGAICVRSASGESYTLEKGSLRRIDLNDYNSEDYILIEAHYQTLSLDIVCVVPESEIYDYIWGVVVMVFLVSILILLALSFLVYRAFSKAEKELTQSARKAAEEEMALKKIEDDLAVAARIQTRMLTSPGRGVHLALEGMRPVDIMSRVIPAREVGGDLYEYRVVGDNLMMCVGDVSGKGLPASVVMTMCCTLFHAYQPASAEPDPAALLSYLNTQLCRRNEHNMFVTMWAGVLNMRTGALRYSSAGHNAPVLMGGSVSRLQVRQGTPLGLFDDAVYHDAECALAPDDAILLYTDGITEAENAEHALFGDDALTDVCGKVVSRSPQVICSAVLCAVRDHAAGALQSDDITLMCVTFDGNYAQLHGVDDVMALHALAEECGGAFRTALALEELSVNAFTYGGASFVSAGFRDGVYTLVDDGGEFDPTAFCADGNDDGMSVGGRGIDIVRKISSMFTWSREGLYNVTRLTINETI